MQRNSYHLSFFCMRRLVRRIEAFKTGITRVRFRKNTESRWSGWRGEREEDGRGDVWFCIVFFQFFLHDLCHHFSHLLRYITSTSQAKRRPVLHAGRVVGLQQIPRTQLSFCQRNCMRNVWFREWHDRASCAIKQRSNEAQNLHYRLGHIKCLRSCMAGVKTSPFAAILWQMLTHRRCVICHG